MIHFISIALVIVLLAGILSWKFSWINKKKETFCPFTEQTPKYVAKIQTNELPSTEDLMLTAANTQSAKYPSKPFWPHKCWKPMSKVSTQVYVGQTPTMLEIGVSPPTVLADACIVAHQ